MNPVIPKRLPSVHLDRAVIAMSSVFVRQIHLSIEFEGHIDADRLARAMRLCMDAEPVLGCQYVDHWIFPSWKRFSDEHLDQFAMLEIEEGDDETRQSALDRFLGRQVIYEEQPQFYALLLRHDRHDRVVIKVNHQVVDAGGTKELGYLIARMYRELGKDSNFLPGPNSGSRSIWQVYKRVLPRYFFKLLWLNAKETYSNSVPFQSINFPSGFEKKGEPVFLIKRFSPDRVDTIKNYGKKKGATINDVVATALTRAYIRIAGWDKRAQIRMNGTVDLRRYIPQKQGEALCNLSSFYFTNLGLDPGGSFDETLGKIKKRIDHAKKNMIGLPFLFGSILMAAPYPEFIMKWFINKFMSWGGKKGNIPPSMTNLGPILEDRLDFGYPEIKRAEVYVPSACPPLFVTGVSGYKNALTFSSGFYESAIPKEKVEKMFDFLDEELPR